MPLAGTRTRTVCVIWGGPLLRQPRLRAIVFLQSKETPTAGTS